MSNYYLFLKKPIDRTGLFLSPRPVSIDLDGLFANKRIVSVTEMSLTANQKRSDVDRLQWITDSDVKQTYKWPKSNNPRRDTITIYPMEYRTYLLTFLESK
eukprot:TRINITY_DN2194_c0_g2_i1.p1 TRINITY_DN2194_c0_g2~~TRINITY_DN2194_c0_g2_i1.p1  ORF type:complete len:101 (-),score=8.16 TRINITY_DN2194_c0_g2_i1:61-363(-)